MRNEPDGWLFYLLEWTKENIVVLSSFFIGYSILDIKIKKISNPNNITAKMSEIDDEIKLPRWFLRAQLIAKPLSYGFVAAILFLMYFPGVKPALSSIKIYLSKESFVTIFDVILILFISGALPFIVLAGNKIDITQYFKKS